jgi:hypothetical protein
VPPAAPQINPVSPVAVEGQPSELVCSSSGGSPDPVLRWYRKGESNPIEGAVTKNGGSRNIATLSTLVVRPMKEDDGAEYRCVAWNVPWMPTTRKKPQSLLQSIVRKNPNESLFFFFFCFIIQMKKEP